MRGRNVVIIFDAADSVYDSLSPNWDADAHLKRWEDVSRFMLYCSSEALGDRCRPSPTAIGRWPPFFF